MTSRKKIGQQWKTGGIEESNEFNSSVIDLGAFFPFTNNIVESLSLSFAFIVFESVFVHFGISAGVIMNVNSIYTYHITKTPYYPLSTSKRSGKESFGLFSNAQNKQPHLRFMILRCQIIMVCILVCVSVFLLSHTFGMFIVGGLVYLLFSHQIVPDNRIAFLFFHHKLNRRNRRIG